MRIDGEWYVCDDGITRPVVRAEVQAADGTWAHEEFLLDTGADRTVLSPALTAVLGLPPVTTDHQLGGIAGVTNVVLVDAQVRLTHAAGKMIVQVRCAGMTSPGIVDMSILGQEWRQLFAFIVDWRGKVVCLLHPPHGYRIVES